MYLRSLFIVLVCLCIGRIIAQELPTKPNRVDTAGVNQGEWILLYDEDWNLTNDHAAVAYYALINYKDGKPVGQVTEFFRSGQVLVEYDSIVQEEPLQYEGMQRVYSEEGNLVSIGFFNEGQMDSSYVIKEFKQLIDSYLQKNPEHLDLAYTANNLAYLYLHQLRYDSAEIYYRMAEEVRRKLLGVHHVIYANSCNKLGYVLVKQAKYEEAEPFYKTSLEVHGDVLGTTSDYYAGARSNLAFIYLKTERYEESERLYREAAESRLEHVNGQDDSAYKYYSYQLAKVYAKQDQWDKALTAYQAAKQSDPTALNDMLWFVELLEE